MVDIVTRLGKGSPLTNAEVDANFTNLAEVSGVTGEPMGHEDRTTSTISFNASTRTFTIAPVASSFTVWCKGKKVVVSTAQTVTIPNTTGMYSIYYDANGVLSAKSGYFTFSLEAPTAYVYWNAATGTAPYFGDERHGVVLDWQTHEYLHRTRGAALASGFSASGYVLGGNGSSNSHAQITLEGGTFFDEDMKIIVTATNTPTAGTWEQDLLSPARIPVLYLSGTGWVIDAPTDYPLKQGTSRPQYNAYSGGVWSTADVANNKYATSWILATNNLTYPVIAIIGQSQNDLQSAAEAVDFTALQLPGFPSVEFRPLYKLIFQCADSCTNAVHASLVSITDIRSIAAAGTAASIVTDHGNLSGLSDDDHPQYIHVDTLRTVSAAVKASFLPSQTSNAGKFLQTDGTATSWQALTSGNVTTALGFTPYNATNPSGYISGITSGMVTTALGFTPYNATNPSGYVTAAGARGAISVTGAGSYDSATGVINIVGGVTSFNTRTGAITLSSADVTTALGFTPYNNTNPSGYITGITSTMVTTALGFTPYNSSNPNGYISSITSANVTTALGFTPYNATNPSGYITSSALSGYLTSASAASTYLPLSGGTLSGDLRVNTIRDTAGGWVLGKYGTEVSLGSAGLVNEIRFNSSANAAFEYRGNAILHAANYNSYSPTLTGTGASGTWGISITGNAATAGSVSWTNISSGVRKEYGNLQFQPDPSSFSGMRFLDSSGNGAGWFLIRGTSDTDVYTAEGITLVADKGWLTLAQRETAGRGVRIMSGTTSTDRIRVTTAGDIQLVNGNSFSYNGNTVLHAANYNSYALPLTGGTLSGALTINAGGGYPLQTTTNQRYQIGIKNTSASAQTQGWWFAHDTGGNFVFHADSSGDKVSIAASGFGLQVGVASTYDNPGGWAANVVASGTHHARVRVKGTTYNSSGDNEAYLWVDNTVGTHRTGLYSSTNFNMNVPNLYESGNRVLNSSNYTSYSPSLGGSGASGTWGIAISGNAATASKTTANAGYARVGYGMAPFYNWGGANAGAGAPSDSTYTTGIDVGSHPSDQAYGFQIASNMWNVGLWTRTYNSGFSGWVRILDSSNYTSYSPSLTGSGASGTWGISVTGNAATAGGLAVHDTQGTQNSANQIVRTQVNGYTMLGWINTTSGDSGIENRLTRIYSSHDSYVRYSTLTDFKVHMGLSAKNSYSRRIDYTSDANYHVGSMGHSGYGANETFHGGSGFFDIWAGTNYPPSTSHIHGFNALHYTTNSLGSTGGNAYGIQVAGQYDQGGLLFSRGCSGGSFSSWRRQIDDNNYSSYAVPLSGGTMTGLLTVNHLGNGSPSITVNSGGSENWRAINIRAAAGGDNFGIGYSNSSRSAFGRNNLSFHCGSGDSVRFHSDGWDTLWEVTGSGGDGWLKGKLGLGCIADLRLCVNGDSHISGVLHMGGTAGSYNSWGSRDYTTSGSRYINANYFEVNNFGYGSTWTFALDNSSARYKGNAILHAGNYTSYSPSLNGSGASGTWGITVSGGSNSVQSTGFGSSNFTWRQESGTFAGQSGWASYLISNHGNGDTYYSQTIIMPFWSAPQYSRKQGSSAVVGPYTFITTENYNNYTYALASKANRANGNFYIDDNYGNGVVGVYSSYRYQGVFAMGDSYKLPADGTGLGTLYGMAWSHPNAGGAAGNLTDHGLLIINNGGFRCAISNSIVASGNVTAYSDERLKTNWRDMPENFVARLAQVKVGIYDRTDEEDVTQVGVSAQSFQKLLPQAIMKAKDEMGTLSVSYGNAALASAVELAKDNVELRARIERLESLINKLIGD